MNLEESCERGREKGGGGGKDVGSGEVRIGGHEWYTS